MPVALSTKQTHEIHLDTDVEDAGGDKSKAPAFICRYLSSEEVITMREAVRSADNCQKRDQVIAELEKAMEGKLIGWRGVIDRSGAEILSGSCRLSVFCSELELFELAEKTWEGSELSALDKKKSRSRSGLITESSALIAPTGAGTPPQQPAKSDGSAAVAGSPAVPTAAAPVATS